VLRLAVDDSNSLCKFNKKFGCYLNQVEELLIITKTLKLDVIGFSFHVGSGCYSVDNFYNAIKDCKSAFDIAKNRDINISIIDIGGGFPGVDRKIKFKDIAEKVNEAMNDFFKDELENKSIQFIAEPGRYFAEKTHTLVLNVIGKKRIKNINQNKSQDKSQDKSQGQESSEDTIIYYLNDGIYGSFNCIFFDHANPTILPFNERDGKLHKSILFGPTCDSIDMIAENIMLPELAIGEWVYIEDFGSYTSASSSNFNGFKTDVYKYIYRT